MKTRARRRGLQAAMSSRSMPLLQDVIAGVLARDGSDFPCATSVDVRSLRRPTPYGHTS